MVIEPLEDMKAKVIKEYFTTHFFKKYYKELLDKIEEELIDKYQKYYEMSVDETLFQKYIDEIERDMWKIISLFSS